MNNPFAQEAFYWKVTFTMPAQVAGVVEDAFDDIALSVSAFEIDEATQRWSCDLLFTDAPDMEEIKRRLLVLGMLHAGEFTEPTIERVVPQDWLALVARDFPPLMIKRFFVHGSHVETPPPLGSIIIQVEAGAAFGSGEHGTTRCCLLALDWLAQRRKPKTVLDMGCGSGILAIAAAKLWKPRVLAVDVDPVSVKVTAENVRINKMQKYITSALSDGYQGAVVKRFPKCDVIISNILARPLVSFAPYLKRHLKPGGVVILSGLLIEQETFVFAAHRLQGFKRIARFTHEGWCTLVLQS